MKIHSTRGRLLASSMICGVMAVAFGGQALAQDAVAPGGAPAQAAPEASNSPAGPAASGEELVVTGSRLRSPNLTSVSPVTAVNNAEIKLEGTTRVEDLINNLPQAFANQGSTVSNGSSGTATIDLRGLGPVRTLVLVDGRRLMPGDPGTPVADLNFIPAQLVERVDVVTGGASATYGADAVAGVVNFIMMKNFEGVRLDAQYSTYQHHNDSRFGQTVRDRGFPTPSSDVWDGAAVDLTGIIGVNAPDGRGNATVYATYRHIDAITQAKRDFSACSLSPNATKPHNVACGGSGTSAVGNFISYDTGGDYALTPLDGGPIRAYNSATDAFNYAPYNYYQRPDERYTFGAMAHYEINKAADVYTQLMFMDDHTDAVIAPSGVFGQTISVPCNSPLLTAAQVATLCTAAGLGAGDKFTGALLRRNVEGGGRDDDIRHTDYRIVAGVKGDLGHGWSYDLYGQYATTVLNETYRNDFSVARSLQALNVTTNAAGQVVCVDQSNGCVPYNIFTQGGVTQEALAFLQTPGVSSGTVNEQIAHFDVTGDLGEYGLKSPWANDGVGINVGAEYRREALNFQVDSEFDTGDLAGQGGPTHGNTGAFDVAEAFGEIRIPIVQDMPFFKSLSIEGGYRYSDYSSINTTKTYRAGVEWAPIEDIRFRASYNRAVRAPNINELYTPSGIGLGLSDDPCSGDTPQFTAAQCANTGVSAAQYGHILNNIANQYNSLGGGNPNLKPETADTYSIGGVIQPRFLPGFNLSVDYFNIKVKDTIQALSPDLVLQDCAFSGDPDLCSRVHRANGTGSLFLGGGYVEGQATNIGFVKTSGIDVNMNYRLPLASWGMDRFGGLDFSLVGTWLNKLTTNPGLPALDGTTVVATEYDCVGYFAVPYCGTPNPEWRHRLRVGWSTPWSGVSVSGSWRFFSQVTNAGFSSNPYLNTSVNASDRRIGAQSFFDLAATWRVKDNYTLRLGVNNIFDKDPPIVTSVSGGTDPRFNGNTYPGVYDALGRYLFVGITADF